MSNEDFLEVVVTMLCRVACVVALLVLVFLLLVGSYWFCRRTWQEFERLGLQAQTTSEVAK